MKSAKAFTPDDEAELAASLRTGAPPSCPRCDVSLDVWPVPPRHDVSYMRDRVRLVCPRCLRTAVLERRDIE
jgi:hypothetical protein